MRIRLLPLAIVIAAALTPARPASADDGASIRRNYVAPIAGTPLPNWNEIELKTPPRKANSPALVIAGAVAAGLGVAGAVTGLVVMSTGSEGCAAGLCSAGARDAGIAVLSAGAGVAAAGLLMVVIGIAPADDAQPTAARRFLPSVAVGPTGGALTWRF